VKENERDVLHLSESSDEWKGWPRDLRCLEAETKMYEVVRMGMGLSLSLLCSSTLPSEFGDPL